MATLKSTFFERFWSRVDRVGGDGCWLWTAACFPKGYGKVALPKSRKLEGAHRIAWLLTNGPIPDGLWVLHKCDTPPCCRPDHLFLGTSSDNAVDMFIKGRHPIFKAGMQSFSRKFTDDQMVAICRRALFGESRRAIARDLGVHRRTIDRIVNKQSYELTALSPEP